MILYMYIYIYIYINTHIYIYIYIKGLTSIYKGSYEFRVKGFRDLGLLGLWWLCMQLDDSLSIVHLRTQQKNYINTCKYTNMYKKKTIVHLLERIVHILRTSTCRVCACVRVTGHSPSGNAKETY